MKRFQILFLLCLALSFTFSIFAQDTKEVIILQTSDVHSRIEPINQKGDKYYNKGGFVRRAAFLEEFRKDHKNVLLFDCGDISQGCRFDWYTAYSSFEWIILNKRKENRPCSMAFLKQSRSG